MLKVICYRKLFPRPCTNSTQLTNYKCRATDKHFSLPQYKYLDGGSSKLVSHNVLELRRMSASRHSIV